MSCGKDHKKKSGTPSKIRVPKNSSKQHKKHSSKNKKPKHEPKHKQQKGGMYKSNDLGSSKPSEFPEFPPEVMESCTIL